jgi:hypothetical protein
MSWDENYPPPRVKRCGRQHVPGCSDPNCTGVPTVEELKAAIDANLKQALKDIRDDWNRKLFGEEEAQR